MTRTPLLPVIALALGAALVPLGASAKDHGRDHGPEAYRAAPGCPPGLAKKHNGCTPPGLAKAKPQARIWRPGERITTEYVVLRDPARYRLDPRATYWRSGDYLYRVDSQTGKVLNLIGAVSALLN